MHESHLVLYTLSRPFEPFQVFMADGRRIDVRHPEMAMVAKYAMSLLLFHLGGELEVLDGGLITALKTLGPVDPGTFAGSQIQEE